MPPIFKTIKMPNRAAWRHAVRMTAAALIAYLATGMVGFHHGYWAVITCLVIVQGSLGATISAGLSRVAGTAAGALLGGIGALLPQLFPALPEWIILLLVIAPLALLASSKAIFRLAPLTGGLILLLAGTGNLGFAFSRVAEIALGTVIGVLASVFILPERATSVLVEHAASLLELLGGMAVVLLSGNDPQAHERIAIKIRGGFAQLQNDMKELENERNVRLLRSDPFPEELSRHLQRLRTDVNMLGRAVVSDGEVGHAELAERIRTIFLNYAAVLRHRAELPDAEQVSGLVLDGASTGPLGFALLTLQAELKALNETLRQQEVAEEADGKSWIHALIAEDGLLRSLFRRRHFQRGGDR
jgi:uncharacterized membrane protein YccC